MLRLQVVVLAKMGVVAIWVDLVELVQMGISMSEVVAEAMGKQMLQVDKAMERVLEVPLFLAVVASDNQLLGKLDVIMAVVEAVVEVRA